MAEPAKSPFENLIVGPSGWPEAYHQLQQLIGARGAILFILFAAALLVWWKWEEIVKRPWIKPAIERFKRGAIDKAPAGVLTIAVAHLQDDDGQKQEKLLLDELKHFDGVETLTVDRAMEWPASGTEQSKKKKAEEEARRLLRQIGADVLIWGSVISLSGKSAMRHYWTPARDVPGAKSTGRYQFQTETLELPIEFWSDLKQILGLLTQPRIAALTVDKPGHYVADKLAPLIAQVRALVQSREGVWNPETLAEMRFSLAVALAVYGDQSGKNEPLVESIELYRKVLEGLGRARVPLDWATTQNNLGNALQRLGERESGTVQFDEAVLAYREALKERTRERAPLQWATTQNNLGTALLRLGERKSDPAKLEGAVEAYGEALQERTRERAPLQWAETQNNLGTALLRLGERENGTARIEGAVIVFHEALQEFTRARVPLLWAKTQNNLGNALRNLGERRSDPAKLEEAVEAYGEALQEGTRERVPIEWAETQNNLGTALGALDALESGTVRLEEAITAFRQALQEFTRTHLPLRWARTQENLALVHVAFFNKDPQPRHLDAALEAVNGALQEYRKANATYDIGTAERLREKILGAKGKL